ncbi:hypothetical protein [Streptomyces sp. NPDC002205]|uniref:hypothetical protein n=1 Tax=Streptomyces sp. NPDC002205 TaxID=3154411 RepID=UPI0033300FE9
MAGVQDQAEAVFTSGGIPYGRSCPGDWAIGRLGRGGTLPVRSASLTAAWPALLGVLRGRRSLHVFERVQNATHRALVKRAMHHIVQYDDENGVVTAALTPGSWECE